MVHGNTPQKGWREVLIGAFIATFSLLPMGAALFDPDASSFPSGRLPALLAGATFFFAGVWILGAGLGRTWNFPVAALLSAFAGVPVAITFADAALAEGALGTPWLSLLQSLLLGGVAAHLWSWVLRERVLAADRTPGLRGLVGSALGLAAISPIIAPLAPLAATVGIAAPLVALGTLLAAGLRIDRLAPRPARLAFTLAGLALVAAPARAIVRLATSVVALPQTQMNATFAADPAMGATVDLLAGGAGLVAVAMAATRSRLPQGALRDAAALLPDRAHAVAAAMLSAGLALSSALALRPELVASRRPELAGMPPALARAVVRLESPDAAWRARALVDLDELDADLAPAIDHLFGLLEHADPGVRTTAAHALRMRGVLRAEQAQPRWITALTKALASPEREVRRLALVALPAAAPLDEEILAAVRDVAVKESAFYRDEALAAIAGSGERGKASILDALLHDHDSMNAALLRAVEPLMSVDERIELHRRLLRTPDVGSRWLAVHGLAALHAQQPGVAADLAQTAAGDADDAVRQAAFLALAERDPGSLTELEPSLLASFLDASLWAARVEARRVLELQGDPRDVVLPALLAALEGGGDTWVKQEAMQYLTRLGAVPAGAGAAERVARCMADDRRQGLVVAAAELLGSMGPAAAGAATVLAEVAAGHDTHAGGYALRALAAIGPPARAALPALQAQALTHHPVPPPLAEAIASITGPARAGPE